MRVNVAVNGRNVTENQIRTYLLDNNSRHIIKKGMQIGEREKWRVVEVKRGWFTVQYRSKSNSTMKIYWDNCKLTFN